MYATGPRAKLGFRVTSVVVNITYILTRHVQKNGVIYKRRAQQQILERTIEEQAYLDSIVNAKI
jgi:hypothetical protein